MGAPRPLHVAMLVIILCLLGADVAEGYFLSSTHGHFWNKIGMAQPTQSSVEKLAEKHRLEHEKAVEALGPSKGSKYPVIEACHLRLKRVFGKYTETWYVDWKLWVGLTFWLGMWAKWLASGFDEIYWQFALFAFGVNVLILHILQYASSIMSGLIVVCSLLTGQALLQSYLTHLRDFSLTEASKLNRAPSEHGPAALLMRRFSMTEASAAVSEDDDLDEFDCDTLYLDIGLPIEQILILFIGQVGVWWFYMTSILASIDFAKVNYLFWAWAYLVMQMTMIFCRGNDSALGNAFPVYDVNRMCKNADKVKFRLHVEEGEAKAPSFQMRKENILLRGVMGFFCNCILREIMAYTIPLMLMGFSEPMDFVVYCVGVNFICTLDDMNERKYNMIPLSDQSEESSVD